jgi:GTP-binding protein
MFVDEVKVFAQAGHGGKGCVAFHREAFITKGGPSGGNGGRGGNVILQADHDLNNLIAQFYTPRLLAEDGKAGMGKGMDGRAGKDLLVRVPCGTLVWKLATATAPTEFPPDEGQGEVEPPRLPLAMRHRPLLPTSKSAAATDAGHEAAKGDAVAPPAASKGDDLVVDLTRHGDQFVLCKGGRGGLGNRNFATARRQTPRFAQPGEPGEAGEF